MGSPFDKGSFTLSELKAEAEFSSFHPALTAALRWLVDDGHLTGQMKAINNQFAIVALNVAIRAPQVPQSTIAVHKLVEAKDAAIRALIEQQEKDA